MINLIFLHFLILQIITKRESKISQYTINWLIIVPDGDIFCDYS